MVHGRDDSMFLLCEKGFIEDTFRLKILALLKVAGGYL